MIKSDDLLLIQLLSKERSIAAVARAMYLTPSAVSQRLSTLEEKLGLKLADRNGRSGIALTDDGEFLASRASEVLNELDVVRDELNERRGVINGVIRLIVPFGFGRRHIAPALGKFSELYPAVTIDLRLSDDLSRSPQSAWDILIRVAPSKDSSLISTELAKNRRLICASPGYIAKNGAPQTPEDLEHHRCIVISEDGMKGTYWHFSSKEGDEKWIKVKPHFVTNDGETALGWAAEGIGIIIRSEWSALPAIKSKKLVEVMPDWTAPEAPIVALTTARRAESVRIQTILTHLKQSILIG